MNRFSVLALTLLTLLSTGCAIGREHAYHNRTLHVPPAASQGRYIAIAVHDRRTEVVSGDKTPDFVGLSRGGWGNPFDVTTASDQPLADDMATSIAASLRQGGYRVSVVQVAPLELPLKAVSKLADAGADRMLLLRLDKWKSDTYNNTALHYALELIVFDKAGKPMARAQQQGDDNLGGSFWNPGGHADDAVPGAFQQKLELLLNDYSVVQALRGENQAATVVPRS